MFARASVMQALNRFFLHPDKPLILALGRPDKRKNISGLQFANILGAVNDPQMPFLVKEAGVARMDPTIAGLGFRRCRVVLVIAGKDAR